RRATNRDDRSVVAQGLLVAGSEAPRLLEQIERALHRRTSRIQCLVEGSRLLAVGLGRDHGYRAAGLQFLADCIDVVSLITQKAAGVDFRNQSKSALAVVLLAAGPPGKRSAGRAHRRPNELWSSGRLASGRWRSLPPPFAACGVLVGTVDCAVEAVPL